MEPERLQKVALVTGGTRGIGRAITLQLARDGYDISFCYLQAVTAAKELEEEIRKAGRHAYHQQLDIRDYVAVQEFISVTEDVLGDLSVVVNNAGIIKDSP